MRTVFTLANGVGARFQDVVMDTIHASPPLNLVDAAIMAEAPIQDKERLLWAYQDGRTGVLAPSSLASSPSTSAAAQCATTFVIPRHRSTLQMTVGKKQIVLFRENISGVGLVRDCREALATGTVKVKGTQGTPEDMDSKTRQYINVTEWAPACPD